MQPINSDQRRMAYIQVCCFISCIEKLLFRNIQTAPPTLSLTTAGSDVILLDTKLVPCCITSSAAAAEPICIGDVCTAKQTGNSLTVGTGDSGSMDHRLETGSSQSGLDRPTNYHTWYYHTAPWLVVVVVYILYKFQSCQLRLANLFLSKQISSLSAILSENYTPYELAVYAPTCNHAIPFK